MKRGALAAGVLLALAFAPRAVAQPAPTLPPGHPAVAAGAAATPSGHAPAATPGAATAPAPAGELPPGHPPVTASAAPAAALPPGHPPVVNEGASTGELPPGHPAVDDGTSAAAPRAPSADSVEPAADLPKGSIEAVILDADDHPVRDVNVRLGILFQKVAEGEFRSERHARTNTVGAARFDGLPTDSSHAYRITLRDGPAEFSSSPFNLKDSGGTRVKLHLFPVTQSLAGQPIGIRGFFYIETRDDLFQVEGLFRVINLGRSAWVPKNVVVGLPAGWKAFSAGESMFGSSFEAVEGRGARLTGTFPPGQRDLNFRFQIPKEAASSATFGFTPPPHSAEIRVIAVASTSMGLQVDGFETPQVAVGPSGDRVLVTRKLAGRGEAGVGPFTVTLTGLPEPGPGRWVAIFIALGFAAAGAAVAAGKWRLVSPVRVQEDRARAYDLLLDELVAVTRAKERGEIGPKTHERTHRTLVDALSRIGLPPARKARRASRAQRV